MIDCVKVTTGISYLICGGAFAVVCVIAVGFWWLERHLTKKGH